MKMLIVDLDGTVSDPTHRLHHIMVKPKNYAGFYGEVGGDGVHQYVLDLVKMHELMGWTIQIVTGRSDVCRQETEAWVDRIGLPTSDRFILMRRAGDFRPDVDVKLDHLKRIRAGYGAEEIVALEDRSRVVRMWRENGVRCLQVANGDF